MAYGHTSWCCQFECMAADLHRWTYEALSGHHNLESLLTMKEQLFVTTTPTLLSANLGIDTATLQPRWCCSLFCDEMMALGRGRRQLFKFQYSIPLYVAFLARRAKLKHPRVILLLFFSPGLVHPALGTSFPLALREELLLDSSLTAVLF